MKTMILAATLIALSSAAYAGRLIAVDKMAFLRELIVRDDGGGWSASQREDRQALVSELYTILQEHIDRPTIVRELNAVAASRRYYQRPNDFERYLQKQIAGIG